MVDAGLKYRGFHQTEGLFHFLIIVPKGTQWEIQTKVH